MNKRGRSDDIAASSHRVPGDRACHAVPATATLAELETLDGDDLDAGLAHFRDRVRVPLIGNHHPGLECDDVVAVVPLLALLLVLVPPGLHHMQLRHAHGIGYRAHERLLLGDVEPLPVAARSEADRAYLVDHTWVRRRL